MPSTTFTLRSFALSLVASVVLLAGSAAPASALSLGFNDLTMQFYAGWYGQRNEAALSAGLANAHGAGAEIHRDMVVWRDVAPGKVAPSAAEAVDPSWSGYQWKRVDLVVKGVVSNGMTPLLWVARAPDWAEGGGRPAVSTLVPEGTWKPSATALGQFATALAKRYDGTFPDPAVPGQTLPRVSNFQAWNEPNLYTEITPQWEQSGGTWRVASAKRFRSLLRAFYGGIKAHQPTATVLAAGTAPFGDLNPGDPRVPPAMFYRDLLCQSVQGGRVTTRKGCQKLPMDGWAHHTYPLGPPTRRARNVNDVVVPDLGKLTKLMNAAVKAKVVTRAAADNLWMTEMSWDSKPDPNGLSLEDHALYMQGAFYVLWKAGVKNIIWWNSRDDTQSGDWNASLQSGVFARGANPNDPTQDVRKPAWTAFHFPFTAYRNRGVAALWSRAPGSGPVTVESKAADGSWVPVATLVSQGGQVFAGRARVGVGTQLRAVQGSEISLTWTAF